MAAADVEAMQRELMARVLTNDAEGCVARLLPLADSEATLSGLLAGRVGAAVERCGGLAASLRALDTAVRAKDGGAAARACRIVDSLLRAAGEGGPQSAITADELAAGMHAAAKGLQLEGATEAAANAIGMLWRFAHSHANRAAVAAALQRCTEHGDADVVVAACRALNNVTRAGSPYNAVLAATSLATALRAHATSHALAAGCAASALSALLFLAAPEAAPELVRAVSAAGAVEAAVAVLVAHGSTDASAANGAALLLANLCGGKHLPGELACRAARAAGAIEAGLAALRANAHNHAAEPLAGTLTNLLLGNEAAQKSAKAAGAAEVIELALAAQPGSTPLRTARAILAGKCATSSFTSRRMVHNSTSLNSADMGAVEVCARVGCTTPPGAPLKLCAACKATRYCGADCQKLDWKAHKAECKIRVAELAR